MTKLDYLKHALNSELYTKIEWFYTFLTIPNYDQNNETYIKLQDNNVLVKVDDNWESLGKLDINKPIFNIKDEVEIDSSWISNVKEKTKTTIGRLFCNKILIERNFKDKIPYINKSFSVKSLESIIGNLMRTEVIVIPEYLSFVDSVSFITNFSKIVNISSTVKSVLPPPGLKKKKNELRAFMENKYGKEWTNNRARVQEYQDLLKEYDKEWIQDDPSYGKLLSGKITNNSRIKMYLTFGGEVGFDKKSGKVNQIDNSLLDGYPKDPKQLVAMFNSSRSGSFDRGHETQKGGAAAKDILRSTSSIVIVDGDCGSKKGFKINVNANNTKFLNGRYLLDGKMIENGEEYIGKEITIRTPMYCLTENGNYCVTCAGKIMGENRNGLNLKLLNISSLLLSLSLKSLHNTQVSLVKYDIRDRLQ